MAGARRGARARLVLIALVLGACSGSSGGGSAATTGAPNGLNETSTLPNEVKAEGAKLEGDAGWHLQWVSCETDASLSDIDPAPAGASCALITLPNDFAPAKPGSAGATGASGVSGATGASTVDTSNDQYRQAVYGLTSALWRLRNTPGCDETLRATAATAGATAASAGATAATGDDASAWKVLEQVIVRGGVDLDGGPVPVGIDDDPASSSAAFAWGTPGLETGQAKLTLYDPYYGSIATIDGYPGDLPGARIAHSMIILHEVGHLTGRVGRDHNGSRHDYNAEVARACFPDLTAAPTS